MLSATALTESFFAWQQLNERLQLVSVSPDGTLLQQLNAAISQLQWHPLLADLDPVDVSAKDLDGGTISSYQLSPFRRENVGRASLSACRHGKSILGARTSAAVGTRALNSRLCYAGVFCLPVTRLFSNEA